MTDKKTKLSDIVAKSISTSIVQKLASQWLIWIHNNKADWKLESYGKLMSLSTVQDFWQFINNFNKLNYMNYQFFIMRQHITPLWEDTENKHGGAITIRWNISEKDLLNLWEDVCILTINETICSHNTIVNGISFNLKENLVVIKIWLKNNDMNAVKKLNSLITEKYKLRPVYIPNRPDY